MRIESDDDGYPTEAGLDELRKWNGQLEEVTVVLDAVAEYFNACGYGSARRRGRTWRFATGGWSGCEEVIGAIPLLITATAWRSSHRGGLHIYSLEEP